MTEYVMSAEEFNDRIEYLERELAQADRMIEELRQENKRMKETIIKMAEKLVGVV